MKKMAAVMLVAAMILSVVSCGGNDRESENAEKKVPKLDEITGVNDKHEEMVKLQYKLLETLELEKIIPEQYTYLECHYAERKELHSTTMNFYFGMPEYEDTQEWREEYAKEVYDTIKEISDDGQVYTYDKEVYKAEDLEWPGKDGPGMCYKWNGFGISLSLGYFEYEGGRTVYDVHVSPVNYHDFSEKWASQFGEEYTNEIALRMGRDAYELLGVGSVIPSEYTIEDEFDLMVNSGPEELSVELIADFMSENLKGEKEAHIEYMKNIVKDIRSIAYKKKLYLYDSDQVVKGKSSNYIAWGEYEEEERERIYAARNRMFYIWEDKLMCFRMGAGGAVVEMLSPESGEAEYFKRELRNKW